MLMSVFYFVIKIAFLKLVVIFCFMLFRKNHTIDVKILINYYTIFLNKTSVFFFRDHRKDHEVEKDDDDDFT